MWIKILRRSIFCFTSGIWLTAAGALDAVPIRWNAAEGAVLYRIEIVDESGRNIFSVDTAELSVEIPLEPGNYRLRISGLNMLRQIDALGEWRPVAVRRRETDEKKEVVFERFAPRAFDARSGGVLTLYGQYLPIGFRAELENADGERTPLDVQWLDAGKVRAALPANGLSPGAYAVILTAPNGDSFRQGGLAVRGSWRAASPFYAGIGMDFFRTNAWWKKYALGGSVFAGFGQPEGISAEAGFTVINSLRDNWSAGRYPPEGSDPGVLLTLLDLTLSWAPVLFELPVNPVFAVTAGYAFGEGLTFGYTISLRVDITRGFFADLGYTWRELPMYDAVIKSHVEIEGIVLRAALRL